MNTFDGATAWSALRKTLSEGDSSGIITVVAGGTEVVASATVSVAVGDIVFVNASVIMTKGGVAGRSDLTLGKKSGSGAVKFIDILANVVLANDPQAAGTVWEIAGTWLFIVTTAGTMDFNIFMTSSGSNGTVADGGAAMGVQVIRGA